MSPNTAVYAVAVLGAVIGVLWMAFFPYLAKKAKAVEAGAAPLFFEKRYIYSTIIAGMVTVVVIVLTVMAMPMPDTASGLLAAGMQGFTYGIVNEYGFNKAAKVLLKVDEAPA